MFGMVVEVLKNINNPSVLQKQADALVKALDTEYKGRITVRKIRKK
jgi:hypothetical protein